MRKTLSILFALLTVFISYSQQTSEWRTYTNMKDVKSISPSEHGVWAATSGGGFYYSATSDSFKTLRRTDGILGNYLTSITADNAGKIWFGSQDGTIDVFNPETNSVKTILDIANSGLSAKQINSLASIGDTILVSSDFGLSLIDAGKYVFFDTYFKFGELPANSKVNSAANFGLFYVCTDAGLAVQKSAGINLSAPESWRIYTVNNGLPSNVIYKVVKYKGDILAATNKGIAIFSGGAWSSFAAGFNGKNITDIVSAGDTLAILSGNTISLFADGSVVKSITSEYDLKCVEKSASMGILSGSTNGILKVTDSSSPAFIAPNGPETNQFPSLAVDQDGNLWSASGRDVTGKGFYKYDGEKWTNYNMANTQNLKSNAFHVIYAAPDNTVYAGSWGNGFVRFKNGSITTYDNTNTGILGIDSHPEFVVISGFGIDSKQNLWVMDYGSANNEILSMLTPDSSWYHFRVPAQGSQYVGQFFSLAVDQYDTKWFFSEDPSRMGLYYFNEYKTYAKTSDDISGYLTTSNGLSSNTVNSIAVDRRGDVWVGTSLGINVISNTVSLLTGNPQLRIAPASNIFSLRQQNINCIAVDPLNQKWVGTNEGLFLLSSDGANLLGSFNTQNSPLLSNQIRSVAINENTGVVYVGTDQGLTSFKTTSIKPEESFTELFIYPSPFIIKNGENRVTINGLIKDSWIKVLNISGKLINEFETPGGKIAYWDGKDLDGNTVSSGVYFIVAYDAEGNSITTGKIAVIRE